MAPSMGPKGLIQPMTTHSEAVKAALAALAAKQHPTGRHATCRLVSSKSCK